MRSFEGGCMCGRVRYAVRGEPLAVSICHCESCRRAAGAQSVAWATFRLADFGIVSGSLTVFQSSRDVERGHCAACGTSITFRETDGDTIDVTVASMSDPAGLEPSMEIWLSHRIGWEAIGDERAQFARGPQSSG